MESHHLLLAGILGGISDAGILGGISDVVHHIAHVLLGVWVGAGK
jgi:hypothetical protein